MRRTILAAVKDFSGADFQAKAAMNPDIAEPQGQANDEKLKPSEQVDYRGVDEGMTSVGVTTQNADTAVLGVTDTPGVRAGSDINAPGVQNSGRVPQGPDEDAIVNHRSDPIAGDNVDDKTGGRVLNDPDYR